MRSTVEAALFDAAEYSGAEPTASSEPRIVARVYIDSPLPHLDGLFDYVVPAKLADRVEVGSRVRVRFSGRLISAVVAELGDTSEHHGKLSPMASSSHAASFDAQGIALARDIAHRYGSSVWDVLRLMVPARVASVENAAWHRDPAPAASSAISELAGRVDALWSRYWVEAQGDEQRQVWEALPGADASQASVPGLELLAAAARATLDGGSSIVVVPDERAIDVVLRDAEHAGLREWSAKAGGDIAVLHTGRSDSARFGAALAAMRGHARIVLGTRAAVLAQVPSLAFIAVWDDGSSTHEEPHSPYFHARTIAAVRSEREGAQLLIGAYAPTVAAAALVHHGWANWLAAPRAVARGAVAAVEVWDDVRREAEGGSGWHWIPGRVWRDTVTALEHGPVLVVVPRAGYVGGVACAECREWAQCRDCDGALTVVRSGAAPSCRVCGRVHKDWHCAHCRGTRLSHSRQGVESIAEQLAKMAPGHTVVTSSSSTQILADDTVTHGIVVATPGAAPAVRGGYARAVVVNADALVGSDMDSEPAAARLVLNAAALVRPKEERGTVVVVGHVGESLTRALTTWSPATLASELRAEREQLGLPPHTRVVTLAGSEGVVARARQCLVEGRSLDDHDESRVIAEVRGSSNTDASVQYLCSRRITQAAVDVVRDLQREFSKAGQGALRLRVDGPLLTDGSR